MLHSALARDHWASTPSRSPASSPAPGPDGPVRVGPQDSSSLPGLWPRPAMALLDALFCCLLVACQGHPCLGLPLAPASGQSPAVAVGESPVTLCHPASCLERWGGNCCSKSGKVPGTGRATRAGRGRQGLCRSERGDVRARATEGSERQVHRAGEIRTRRGEVCAPVGAFRGGARQWFTLCLRVLRSPGKGGNAACLQGKNLELEVSPTVLNQLRAEAGLRAPPPPPRTAGCKCHWDFCIFCPAHGVWWPFLPPGRVPSQPRCYPPLRLP